jgi:erythrin-vacuolar iron transport family protein
MAKMWSQETRPLTTVPEQGTASAYTTGQLAASTRQSEAVVTDAATGDEASRRLLLRVVQPGLAGLMDGSVSTLAPIFATQRPFTAFLVGIAAALGAGISMAFSEALSDDGALTGRGNPIMRGSITGAMTFLGGSLHTLPFLVADLRLALLAAYIVVAVELVAIAAIRHRFFGTSWWLSVLQVVGGGALVFAAAWMFGNA